MRVVSKILLAICVLFYSIKIASQCPDDANRGVNGSKDCLELSWAPVPGNFMTLTFMISGTSGTFTYESGSGTSGSPAIYKRSGANCNGVVPAPPFTGSLTVINGTSETCTYNNGGVLPVNLTEYEVLSQESGITLYWKTVKEVNNDFFIIQRSSDGDHFTDIGKVKGAGNSDIEQVYMFNDPTPLSGLFYYYRLVQYNFNSTEKYYPILVVKNRNNQTKFHFNPYIKRITFSQDDQFRQVIIYNIEGKPIWSQKPSSFLDLHHLNPGIYIISLLGDHIISKRIILY